MSKPDEEMRLSAEEKEYVHQYFRAYGATGKSIDIIMLARISGRPVEEVQRELTIVIHDVAMVAKQFPTKPWAELDVAKAKANEN